MCELKLCVAPPSLWLTNDRNSYYICCQLILCGSRAGYFREMTSLTRTGGGQKRPGRHKLSVVVPSQHSRARSPVTVQEWVAALPDNNQETRGDEEEKEEEQEGEEEQGLDDSQLVLGAEAGYETSNVAKLLLQRNNTKTGARCLPRQLQHSDTATSFRSHSSHLSHLSVSR